jgi:quercetin 2,3-dioxygenase
MNKQITQIYRPDNFHWVGDGFPVTTLFSYNDDPRFFSPFLLLDYAGPADFKPADKPRGVGMHPHRGFETVTIVYQGEVEHRDNKGNSGKIGPGDVQWMTAAHGILHEEMHSRAFTESGGSFEAIQLWVNLPAAHKMDQPHYQEILAEKIPVLQLEGNAGEVRLIAGEYDNLVGTARTYTPMNLWDIRLNAGHDLNLTIPDGYNCLLLVLGGEVRVNKDSRLGTKELAVFERAGDVLGLSAEKPAKLLVLSGEPIDEPMIGQGPFVMNNAAELNQAFADFQAGKF